MRHTTRTRTRTTTASLAAAALLLAPVLSACGQEAKGGSRYHPEGGEGSTVGIAMPTKSMQRWIDDGRNMEKQLRDEGYRTDLQYGDDKVENQIAQIENMITKGYELLVIAAIDGSALTNVLQKAKDSGTRVIAYDRLIMGTENVDCYVSFDNERVGRLQGRYLVKSLDLAENGDRKFNIELFAGSPDDNNTRYFWEGAMKELRPHIESKQLVVRSGQTRMNQATTLRWDGGTAQKRMDDLLSENYGTTKIDGVLAPADAVSLGVVSALKGAGYGTGSRPFPVVTGQDAELPSVKSIKAGQQTQTVFKDTRKLAKQAVRLGDALLNGKKPTFNNTEDYDNGEKVVPAYLLDPVSVDKENVQLLVDSGYYTEAQLK